MRRLQLALLAIGFGLLGVLTLARADTLEQQAQHAAIADGVTTLGGLALGAAEANPIGLIGLAAKAPLLAYVKTLPDDERAEWNATYAAMWGGASANNLCIVAAIATGGALAPICPMVGMAWGLNTWDQSAMQRELWAICREERDYWQNPDLVCGFLKE